MRWLFLLFIPSIALAEVDLRLSYGVMASSFELKKIYTGGGAVPNMAPLQELGADIIYFRPLENWGAGLRYEQRSFRAGSSTMEFSGNLSRASVLGYYRLANSFVYMGPIGSFGLLHTGNLIVKEQNTEISSVSSSKNLSYSLGFEGGLHYPQFSIGAEIGYQTFIMKEVSDSGLAALSSGDLNLSGSYAKILVGFNLF